MSQKQENQTKRGNNRVDKIQLHFPKCSDVVYVIEIRIVF